MLYEIPCSDATLMRLLGSLLRALSPLLRSQPLRLQSQMDIHSESLWHSPNFARSTSGFFPHRDGGERWIESGPAWDSVHQHMLVLREIETRRATGSLAELGGCRGDTSHLIHHEPRERVLCLFNTFRGFAHATSTPNSTGQKTRSENTSSPTAPLTLCALWHHGTATFDSIQLLSGKLRRRHPAESVCVRAP